MKNRTGLVIPVLIAAAALLQACGDRMTCGKDDAGGCMTTDGGCPGCLCDSGGGADSGITADTGALDAGEADGGGDSGQTDGSADGGVLDGGSKSVLRISGGYDHTCALNSGGGVKCWGRNNVGQLGDGTTVDGLGAVQVAGLSSGVVSISAGFYHTCALLEGGFVKCWGYNYAGQLGDNSIDDKHMPVEVRGLPPGVVSVSAGFYHTCALTASGGVKCWGSNSNGQLGYGLGGSRSLPVDVDGLASGVKSVAACGFHTCAVLSPGGGVKCWGANGFGQIGDGATDQRYSPVDVSGMGSGVKSISGGGNHTCALLEGGGVKCWGLNSSGQVGDGTNENRKEPVGAAGLSSGVAGLSSNAVHTCALTENGDVKCWGGNAAGQLGDGTNIDRNLPTAPGVLPKGVAGVAAGGTHSCAILPTGGVACWGGNSYGQLGDGTTANKNVPVHMAGSPGAVAFSAAGYHTCSIDGDGGLKCWGANNYGQLGDGTSVLKSTPVEVAGLNAGAAEITGGELHTCALMKSGGIKCWGYNALGQLGDGTLLNRATPVDVPGLDGGVSSVQARGYHTCVIHGDGGVKCWGYNGQGQIGDGTNETRKAPTDVSGLTEGVNAIAAGFFHTCALTSSGGIKCWGGNTYGQLGDGTLDQKNLPVDVSGLTTGAAGVTAGGYHTCALLSSGGVKCWGYNKYGQLGDGSKNDRKTPGQVSGLLSGTVSVSAGGYHTCALSNSASVSCWGVNSSGQLGDGTNDNRVAPNPVEGLFAGADSISAGYLHTCAAMLSGGGVCWGDNSVGQLGDGSAWKAAPVEVLGLQ